MFSITKIKTLFVAMLATFLAAAPLISASASAGTESKGSTNDLAFIPQLVQSSVVYGIDDNNIIWEIDPINKTYIQVNNTELTGISNSMAYDTERDQFFFIFRTADFFVDNILRSWNRNTTGINSVPIIANRSQLGLPAQIPQPANAAYYNDAYWFIPQASTELHRIQFTYAGNTPTLPTLTTFDLSDYAAPQYPGGGFGDIAITDTGMLYGSQTNGGRFFSINLNLLNSTSNVVYTEIKAPSGSSAGYQLSFDADYDVLFAHDFDTGDWYTIDITTGNLTSLNFSTMLPVTGTGFRDLGGASATRAPANCEISDPDNTNNQSALVNTAVTNPPAVLITDSNGEPVEAVDVVFTVATGGGNLGGQQTSTIPTGVGGLATAPTWTLGANPGTNTVTASVGNLCTLTFTATATPPAAPSIGLTKEVTSLLTPSQPGDRITWLLTATNTGNVPLTEVVIVDPLTETEYECGNLAVEATCTVTVDYFTTQADIDAGEVINEATVSGFYNETPVSAVADAEQPTVTSPNLSLNKTATYPVPPKAGDLVSYALEATNIGNVTLTNVTITEELEGVSPLVCDPVQPSTLLPQEVMTCTTTYPVQQADIDNAELINNAKVVANDPQGEQLEVDVTLTVPLASNPAMELTKELNRHIDVNNNRVIDPGDELIWDVIATNTGNTTLFDVVIDDPLTKDNKTCGVLAPEQTCSLTTKPHKVTTQDADRGTVLNEAVATGVSQTGTEIVREASNIQPVSKPGPAPAPANVTPASGGTLPQTGATVETLIWGALALIIAGGMTYLLARKPQTA